MRTLVGVAVVVWVSASCAREPLRPRPLPEQAPRPAAPEVATPPSKPALPPGPPAVEIGATAPAPGDVGTSGILSVQAAEPSGAWVLVCEVREDTDKDGKLAASWGHHGELFGDEPAPYLIRGDGKGEKLDELVAIDPSLRYLAVMRGKVLEILDTQSSTRTAVPGADTRYIEGGVFSGGRAWFTRNAEHVLYTRAPKNKGDRRMIVVRRLADGVEHEIDPGGGELRGVTVRGDWVIAHVFEPIKGQQYKLSSHRSGPTQTQGARRCRANIAPDLTNTEERWAPIAGGAAKKQSKVITALGSGFIAEGDDGSLSVVDNGTTTELAAAACGAAIFDVSQEHESALFACAKSASPADVQLWRNGAARVLDIKIESDDFERLRDKYPQWGERLSVVSSTTGTTMVDLASGRTRPTKNHYPLATHGTKVLMHQRDRGLAVYDLDTGAWIDIPGNAPDSGETAQRGRLFAAGRRTGSDDEPLGMLVDLEAGKLIGTFTERAYAVSTTGWILTPVPPKPGIVAASSSATMGPLRWVRPTPVP